ncbi:MAG: hypothetical protein H6719_30700 [Sandaracinaceae bacterium]|nr:hypothetical protein [Sandaracinaceae bacterium]
MHTRVLLAGLAAMLIACGGGDDTDTGSEPVATTGGDEAADPGGDGDDGAATSGEDEAPDEEDDGMSCVPVSRCHSFANQDCTLVDGDGAIQGEQFSSGSVERACPGERGVAASVTECFDYVEISDGCRRRPELRNAEWPCGRTDTARCGVVM